MHLLPGSTQGMAALAPHEAPPGQSCRRCPVPPLQGTGGVTWRDSLWLSVELFSPFISTLSQHSHGDNCFYLLDLYPTMVMSCIRLENVRAFFLTDFPARKSCIHVLSCLKWLTKITIINHSPGAWSLFYPRPWCTDKGLQSWPCQHKAGSLISSSDLNTPQPLLNTVVLQWEFDHDL